MTNLQSKLMLLQDVADDNKYTNIVLDKLLNISREQYKKRLKLYDTDLSDFENRYQMSSDSFYEKFEAGELGDEMNFFEWSGLVELRRDLLHKLSRLESADEIGK